MSGAAAAIIQRTARQKRAVQELDEKLARHGTCKFTLTILSCSNLLPPSHTIEPQRLIDPFVAVSLSSAHGTGSHESLIRTHTVANDRNPRWGGMDAKASVFLHFTRDAHRTIQFNVWNWIPNSNELIGTTELTVGEVFHSAAAERTVQLSLVREGRPVGLLAVTIVSPQLTTLHGSVRTMQCAIRRTLARKSVQRHLSQLTLAKEDPPAVVESENHAESQQQPDDVVEDDPSPAGSGAGSGDDVISIHISKAEPDIIVMKKPGEPKIRFSMKPNLPNSAPPLLRAAIKDLTFEDHSQARGHRASVSKQSTSSSPQQNSTADEINQLGANALLLLSALRDKVNTFLSAESTSTVSRSKLQLIEAGCFQLLRDSVETPAFSPKPTLLQVVFDPNNAEVDLVRKANDSTNRTLIERLPISLSAVNAKCDDMEKLVKSAQQHYDESSEKLQEATANPHQIPQSELHSLRLTARQALVDLHAARLDLGLWRENKAVLQFSLEVMHSAEAGQLPIAADPKRQQPLTMLRVIRSNINHLEEMLREAQRLPASPNSSRRADSHIIDKVAIYRDLETLRNNEAVLEACLAEKKNLLALIHRDRLRFVEDTHQLRSEMKEKDKEVMRATAKATALQRELDQSRTDIEGLKKQLNKQAQRIESLHNHLDAIKEKRKNGESPSPYSIVSDNAHPKPITDERTQHLLQRLYDREVQKILHPKETQSSLVRPVEPIELDEFTKRMYYARKDRAEKQMEALQKKYLPSLESRRVVVPKEKVVDTVERLAVKQIQEKNAKLEKIYEEHVLARDPVMVKRTAEEQAAIIERLRKGHNK
jgi:hypothetical protein